MELSVRDWEARGGSGGQGWREAVRACHSCHSLWTRTVCLNGSLQAEGLTRRAEVKSMRCHERVRHHQTARWIGRQEAARPHSGSYVYISPPPQPCVSVCEKETDRCSAQFYTPSGASAVIVRMKEGSEPHHLCCFYLTVLLESDKYSSARTCVGMHARRRRTHTHNLNSYWRTK